MWVRPEPSLPLRSVSADAVVSIVAVLVAVVLPLGIERVKRPTFSFSTDSPADLGEIRYLNVRIINRPLGGLLGKWLLRNTATGCIASVSFKELGSGKRPVEDAAARWAAKPEPVTMQIDGSGSVFWVPDITKLGEAFRLDLSPSQNGETVVVALKHEGDAPAYAVSEISHREAPADRRAEKLKLPGDEYRVTIRVEAGGVYSEADFRMRNRDSTLNGFSIQPWRD